MDGEKRFCWKYLLEPEGEGVPVRCRLVRSLKALLWLAFSILLGLSLGQLT